MAIFVKRIVNGLEGASGGGHITAAGAHFLKKDFERGFWFCEYSICTKVVILDLSYAVQ